MNLDNAITPASRAAVSAIAECSTIDELDLIYETWRAKRDFISAVAADSIPIGALVEFEGKKRGKYSGLWRGRVTEKKNGKLTIPDAHKVSHFDKSKLSGRPVTWTMPAHMVTVIESTITPVLK